MNLTIKSYISNPISEILTTKNNYRPGSLFESVSPEVNSNAGVTVSISSSARALYSHTSDNEQAATTSKSNLKGRYDKGQSDLYNFGQLIANGKYNRENFVPSSDDPNRLSLGEKSLDFAIGLSKLPPKILPNPFEGIARNDLSAIVYEGSGTYTDAERYAAYAELSKQDETYFSKLALKITNGGDNREIFKDILDYFDDLPLIEKSAYPDGFRDSIESLYQEQIELWGEMTSIDQSSEDDLQNSFVPLFDNQHSSQKMLQEVLQKTLGIVVEE